MTINDQKSLRESIITKITLQTKKPWEGRNSNSNVYFTMLPWRLSDKFSGRSCSWEFTSQLPLLPPWRTHLPALQGRDSLGRGALMPLPQEEGDWRTCLCYNKCGEMRKNNFSAYTAPSSILLFMDLVGGQGV